MTWRAKQVHRGPIMGCNKIIWASPKADKSAVGAMNRPLRAGLEHTEIGETGLAALVWSERTSNKAHLPRSVSAILCLANKSAINKEFEIAAFGNDEQGILLSGRCDGSTLRILDEIIVLGASIRIMAAQEKFSLVINFEIVELIGIGAENQACIVAREQGDIHLQGGIIEGLGIHLAGLKEIC